MTFRLSRVATLSLFLFTLALLATGSARATGNSGKFTGWWELGGFYGTDETSRGEAVLFTPLMQSATTLFFLDARGKLFEEDVQEANVALGYRQMTGSGWNFGVWGGWDIRDTETDNTFHQVSFGVEALSERFDVRVNGYVPVTDPKVSPSLAEVVLQGNNIFLIGGEEVPLHGVDGEVGVLLFGGNRGGGLKGAPAKRHELRAYAGGFWFDSDDALEEVAGPKGRLEYRINDVIPSLPGSRLTIESELSHDEVRDTRFEIGARLRIPFGARGSDAASRVAALNAQELRMIEGLERDTDIVTVQSKEENVIDDATNVALNAVSFASNAAGFATGVAQGGNRLIILQGGGQQIDVSATDGQQLQANQTVQGGSSTINVRGAKSGIVAPFTAPGARPTLFTNDTNGSTGAITLASNTHVAGLNIRGAGDQITPVAGNRGIYGVNDLNNIVIEQSDIRNMGNTGIQFVSNNSNVRIYNTNIENVGGSGIRFSDENSNVSIRSTSVRNVRGIGIRFTGDNSNLDLQDLNINGTLLAEGIQFGSRNSNITLRDIRVANTEEEGLAIGSENRNLTAYNIDIDTNFADDLVDPDGIQIGSNNSNFTFDTVTIKDVQSNGIELQNGNANIQFSNVTITNPGSDGISVGNDNENLRFRDVTIINPDVNGFEFNNNNTVTIKSVQISNSGENGIAASSGNTLNITDTTITGAGNDGFLLLGVNTVSMNSTTFSGAFGDDVIDLNAGGSTLDGTGNVFNGTFGDVFCEVTGAQNGTLGFPGGPSNCPP